MQGPFGLPARFVELGPAAQDARVLFRAEAAAAART
jgi:hypothetical protein